MSADGQPDFEQLFGALPTAAFLMEKQRFVVCNAALCALAGYPAERLVGQVVWDLVAPEDREKVQARYHARVRGEPVTPYYEFSLLAGDGTRRKVEMTATVVPGGRSLGVLRDVGLFARDSQLVAALSESSSRVQKARTLAEVLEVTVEELERIGLYPYLSRFENGRLVALPPRRPSALFLAVLEQTRQRKGVAWKPPEDERLKLMGQGPERAHFVDDFREVNRYHLRAMGLDLAALEPLVQQEIRPKAITVSLMIDRQFWGTLTVSADRLRPEDVGAVALFAGQVASAMEVAQSLESLRQTNRQLAAVHAAAEAGAESELSRLVPRLLRAVAEGTGSPLTSLWLREGSDFVRVGAQGYSTAYLALQPRLPEGPGMAVEALLTRDQPRAFTFAELPEPLRSQIASERVTFVATLPLVVENKRMGVLTLARTDARPFLAQDLEAGKLIAGQVAIQIEKARLIEGERRRVHDLQLLFDVARVITATLDPEEILEAAAANIARLIDATDAFIWIYDPPTRTLRGATTSTPEFREHFRKVRLDLDRDTTAAGRALQTGRPVRIADAASSAVINPALNATYQVKSLVALPLLLRDEAIGAVTIGDRFRTRPWTESEVERAQVMASQVAVAMANARLFDDLKQSYEKLARTQEELVKRERLAALGELSAVVAHEVRNPLGVIFNALGALRRAVRGNAPAEHLMGIVGEEADRLNHIVSDLLDFARPNEPALRAEAPAGVLRSAREAALAITGDAVNITLELAPELPEVRFDARMVRQALINLLVNAAQASPRGAPVTLRAAFERGMLRVEVVDKGTGIAPALQPRIFQPFFTTKATGTGLGLAVVKRIAEAHGGEVQVQSAEGKGTTFTLRLPLSPPGAARPLS